MSLKVLGLCGSVRECSLSRRVLDEALRIAQAEGGDATCFNFREKALPLYDEDVLNESGVPSEVEELKMAVKEADVILLATPEYNSSITPLMKNAIDWVSIRLLARQVGRSSLPFPPARCDHKRLSPQRSTAGRCRRSQTGRSRQPDRGRAILEHSFRCGQCRSFVGPLPRLSPGSRQFGSRLGSRL